MVAASNPFGAPTTTSSPPPTSPSPSPSPPVPSQSSVPKDAAPPVGLQIKEPSVERLPLAPIYAKVSGTEAHQTGVSAYSLYRIDLKMEKYEWTVFRRYKQFQVGKKVMALSSLILTCFSRSLTILFVLAV